MTGHIARLTGARRSLEVERSTGHAPRGQILVIVGLGLVAIIAMVGLVVDGGYAWGRQRDTQNGADAVAKAGTVVVQHHLRDPGSQTDWDVGCAVASAAAANQVTVEAAEYTDFNGDPLVPGVAVGACGATDPGAAIPARAQGVSSATSETFEPFLMQVVGFDTLTASADATAVVGTPAGIPGGALPLTFPQTFAMCDDSGLVPSIRSDDGDGTWEPYEILSDGLGGEALATSTNLAILPLCDTATSGSVGWLDYDCGLNLREAILDPCSKFINIPDWIHTQTGNVNSLEDELNLFAGDVVGTPEGEIFGTAATDAVVLLPIHSNTCLSDPNADEPPDVHDPNCPEGDWSGNGDNSYYEAFFWVGFKIDQAYTGGGDIECQQGPGQPQLFSPNPPGKVGCLKGWIVSRVDAPGPISLGEITPGENVSLVIALIE